MEDDVTFSMVRKAIEIADRIEKLEKEVRQRKKDLIHTSGAIQAVCIDRNELQEYFHYDQLGGILYQITKPGKDWDVGRCCGEIFAYLRQ